MRSILKLAISVHWSVGWSVYPFLHLSVCPSVTQYFLIADPHLYKRLCPSVSPSVGPSVGRGDRVEKWKNERFGYFLCMFVCGGGVGWGVDGVGVRMGVGCPCPPVRNDIVTPRHLFAKDRFCE